MVPRKKKTRKKFFSFLTICDPFGVLPSMYEKQGRVEV